jgi:hypothetical protein
VESIETFDAKEVKLSDFEHAATLISQISYNQTEAEGIIEAVLQKAAEDLRGFRKLKKCSIKTLNS